VSLTYIVQEVITHYCSQGSKLYSCLIDIKQAFDTINWNTLLYKLHKVGVNGKMWCLFNEWLNESTCSVLINGALSKQFSISRSIKQGGLLSMFFFCVAYHDIHSEVIRPPAKSLMYYGMDVSSPTFADDTMVMSLSVNNLQAMLDNIYLYGMKWRITFSPDKSMCVTFGESKHANHVNKLSRQWYLGDIPIKEEDHVVYLGTKLCAYRRNLQRTEDRCKKGYALLGSLTALGFSCNGLSPITSATLWHRLCMPSILYACEVWGAITEREHQMLEVVQHKVAKHLQGLHKRTRNEIVLGLLGWHSMRSNIHRAKLLFLRQLVFLDNMYVIKRIFMYQMYSSLLGIDSLAGSITADLLQIVDQYNLMEYVHGYLAGGVFPGKREWKAIVNEQICARQQRQWQDGLISKNACRYLAVQPLLKPNILYSIIKHHKSQMHNIMILVKMLSIPDKCDPVKCTVCDKIFTDYVEHVFTRCEKVIVQRNELWDNMLNAFGVETEVELFSKTEEQCTRIMLGMEWSMLDTNQLEQFICIVANKLQYMYENTNIHQIFVGTR